MHVLDTVGKTPVVELSRVTDGLGASIALKLERTNPAGSMKDRVARFVIDEAEQLGLLRPGGTIIESSSGNFGIALAMIGAARGYRVLILVDPKTTEMNKALLRAYGAEVIVVTRLDDAGSYHKTRIALANELHRKIPNSYRPDQCFNLRTSEAHYCSIAPELLEQCGGELSAVVCAVSTGGLLGGLSRYFAAHAPVVRTVAVDAVGSGIFGHCTHGYLLPGIGLGWTPNNLYEIGAIDTVYKVPDDDAFVACRTLARDEGLLLGGSTGACIVAAMHLATELGEGARIVCIASDSGERYLDTVFSETWLRDKGLTTESGSALLRQRARCLVPFSRAPDHVTNFRPELAAALGSATASVRPDPMSLRGHAQE